MGKNIPCSMDHRGCDAQFRYRIPKGLFMVADITFLLLTAAALAVPMVIFYLHQDAKDFKYMKEIWDDKYSPLPHLVQLTFKIFSIFLSADFVITLLHCWTLKNYCRCCGTDVLETLIFVLYSLLFLAAPFAWGGAFGVLYHELPEWSSTQGWNYWHEIMPIVIVYGCGTGLQTIMKFMIVCKLQIPCCGEDFEQEPDEERQPLKGPATKSDVESPAESADGAPDKQKGGCAGCCR